FFTHERNFTSAANARRPSLRSRSFGSTRKQFILATDPINARNVRSNLCIFRPFAGTRNGTEERNAINVRSVGKALPASPISVHTRMLTQGGNPTSAQSVGRASIFTRGRSPFRKPIFCSIRPLILEKNLINAWPVGRILLSKITLKSTREFTQERNLTSVGNVARRLLAATTSGPTSRFTQG
uniref:Uncharacterized protein n=1 Tax=Naja naja TaxID=35670 RepID=A0A8C6XKM8_NAJNA